VNAICLSVFIQEGNIRNLLDRLHAAKPDLVEYRLDYLEDPLVLKTVAKSKTCPIIATDRSSRDESKSRDLLLEAAEAGFDFIDVELSYPLAGSIIKQVKAYDVGVVISHHDLSGTTSEEELLQLLQAEKNMGGEICKIVTTATNVADNLTVLSFVNKCSQTTRVVSFAMGKLGVISRVLSPFFGAEFTFAALNDGSRTAEGQLSIDSLRRVWNMLGIS
jgi:3-dehydroquinate dehydratase type I